MAKPPDTDQYCALFLLQIAYGELGLIHLPQLPPELAAPIHSLLSPRAQVAEGNAFPKAEEGSAKARLARLSEESSESYWELLRSSVNIYGFPRESAGLVLAKEDRLPIIHFLSSVFAE
jgi:hypothetical protein